MSAEKHALDAALDYSRRLEQQLERTRQELQEERVRRDNLQQNRQELQDVWTEIRDRLRYVQVGYLRCPNCGSLSRPEHVKGSK